MRSGLQTGMKKPPYGGLVHIVYLGHHKCFVCIFLG